MAHGLLPSECQLHGQAQASLTNCHRNYYALQLTAVLTFSRLVHGVRQRVGPRAIVPLSVHTLLLETHARVEHSGGSLGRSAASAAAACAPGCSNALKGQGRLTSSAMCGPGSRGGGWGGASCTPSGPSMGISRAVLLGCRWYGVEGRRQRV